MVTMESLGVVYFILLAILAWRRWSWATALFVVSLPAYLIRFSYYGLPTTLLEIGFGALFSVWLFRFANKDVVKIKKFFQSHYLFTICFAAFFVASVCGVVVSDKWYISLGQWRAYFLEPMLVFVMLVGRQTEVSPLFWPRVLTLSALPITLLASVQKLFGTLAVPSLWNDDFGGRVTAFFTSPNAIGLFVAPLIFLLPVLYKQGTKKDKYLAIVSVVLSVSSILVARSTGALIGLGAGLIVYLLVVGYKKIPALLVLLATLITILVPSFRTEVLFQDQAGQNRLRLWQYTTEYLSASPQNFVTGAGIRMYFRKVQKPHYNVQEMERLIYPHNIFLNFWSEVGLFGMLSIVGILFFTVKHLFILRYTDRQLSAVGLALLTVFVVHGLVDVPYFKNDLAMLFWVITLYLTTPSHYLSKETK